MKAKQGILVLVLFGFGSVSLALAGEVFGKITRDGAPVQDASVSAKCKDTEYPAVKTDAAGSYYLKVKEPGKCTLTVDTKGQVASFGFGSYEEGVQVDLVLETKDGKLTARRK